MVDSWQEQQISCFSKTSGPALGPTQPPVQWVSGSYLGQQPEREADLVPSLRTSGAVNFHGVIRNNLTLCIYIPLYDGGGVCKPSPLPPPRPQFLVKLPQNPATGTQNTHCLLTEERNTVRESPKRITILYFGGGGGCPDPRGLRGRFSVTVCRTAGWKTEHIQKVLRPAI